ncbi:MAG: hypothetical protein K2Y51_21240 [Gammaproteobacteria bacterium]|nr:hypothetical protein [Gammaproteobacteria bacterium]
MSFLSTKVSLDREGRSWLMPAFASRLHAALFAGLIALVMLAPLLTGTATDEDRALVYKSVPLRYLNYFTVGELLRRPENIDILFIGGSETQTSIDVGIVSRLLSENLGRPVNAANLGTNWAGFDRSAQILKDVIERKKPRLVVLGETVTSYQAPHYLAKFFWDGTVATGDWTWLEKLPFYYARLLGVPRWAWRQTMAAEPRPRSRIVGTRVGKLIDAHGFMGVSAGWRDRSKGRAALRPLPEVVEGRSPHSFDFLTLRPGERQAQFSRATQPYTCFQTKLLLRIRQMATDAGARFATLVPPTDFKADGKMLDSLRLRPLCGSVERAWPTIGISMADLFPGLDLEAAKSFYRNPGHLNRAGATSLTMALMPAVQGLYRE